MFCKINGSGGGSIDKVIQGIVEEYMVAAGGNVNMGDFVKLIPKYKAGSGEISEDTMLINDTISFKAVQLSMNKAFITYIQKVGSNYYLKTVTCTIEGNTITLDNNAAQILETVYNASVDLIKLKENKVIIINRISNNFKFYTCTIAENSIICNTDINHPTEISSNYSTPTQFIALSEDKFVMLYASSTNSSYPISLLGRVRYNQ